MDNTKLPDGLFIGRVGRGGFILGHLYYFIWTVIPLLMISLLFSIIISFLPHISRSAEEIPAFIIAVIWYVVYLTCAVSLFVRRLHDLGRPGIYTALLLVPFLGLALVIYLLISPGNLLANRYGDPNNSYNITEITKFRLSKQA